MCGIVGATTRRNSTPILLEGLRRLEYRGYDSAGVSLAVSKTSTPSSVKAVGKVQALIDKLGTPFPEASSGIAHTRWATHGIPSEQNAHPHVSSQISLVHNGIIENHEQLRQQLIAQGYSFQSQTDTEVVAHLLHSHLESHQNDMLAALASTLGQLEGAYALAITVGGFEDHVFFARKGSPLVVGLGFDENFLASDQLALRPVTDTFIFLEEGDYGLISPSEVKIFDQTHTVVSRSSQVIEEDGFDASKGQFKHYMLKEIYEQPMAIQRCLAGRVNDSVQLDQHLLAQVESIQIIACGTSYHAGLIAKQWIEDMLSLPVFVEVASEYRYRNAAVLNNCLFLTISQSGETADTLAALKLAKSKSYMASLVICNVDNSSLVRESDMAVLTHAGPEIGVASTKAFTTQLAALLLLVKELSIAKHRLEVSEQIITTLKQLPLLIESVLAFDGQLKALSASFADKHHALFLGRGAQYPVAMEGALKLKEISYIHAEAYAAGELKHGPIALVDEDMPVIAVAPNNDVLGKIRSNLEEVKARGGKLYVFADEAAGFIEEDGLVVINIPHVPDLLEPIVYSVPLQLLAYYVAIVKGTDVDQPRNLAKSVTVE